MGRIDEADYSFQAYERLEKIRIFKKLRSEGCTIKTALKALAVPQSTFYRWKRRYKKLGLHGLENESKRPNNVRKVGWSDQLVRKVLFFRKQNPLYGKAKITVLLKRDHRIQASVSTVGRIISFLIKKEKIKSASFYYAKKRARPRKFDKHAQRWKVGMKAKEPGELVQIDHMSVTLSSSFHVKHFQAICPVTKAAVKQAYSRATSSIAKQFLEYARSKLPFGIQSIQVDGGSEFMKDFEQAAQTLNIPLYVLPPRSPEYNGNVERANGTSKFEFYAFYDGPENLYFLRKKLQRYVRKYNSYRPHQALQYRTPLEYYRTIYGA